MSDLLIVKNISREGPGLLQTVLSDNKVSFDITDLDSGDMFPDPRTYKALIVLGGPDSANDTTDKMIRELEQIKVALKAGLPYLGICLGLQTLVKAADGKVIRSDIKEVGFMSPDGTQFTVESTEDGKRDPLLAGLEDTLKVFQLHGETVELTDKMTILATGKYCRNQIVKVADRAYGIQSHFELTTEMLKEWALNDSDLMPLGSDQLLNRFSVIEQTYTQIGLTLFRNFLNIAGLI